MQVMGTNDLVGNSNQFIDRENCCNVHQRSLNGCDGNTFNHGVITGGQGQLMTVNSAALWSALSKILGQVDLFISEIPEGEPELMKLCCCDVADET